MENNRQIKQLYFLARITLVMVWVYQGLVPKLLGPDDVELAMNMALGLSRDDAALLSYIAGAGEMVFGLALLVFWRQRWPVQLNNISLIALLIYAVWAVPQELSAAFNPLIVNLPLVVLGLIALHWHGLLFAEHKESAQQS